VPTGPGLGVEIDWDKVDEFRMDREDPHPALSQRERVHA
jgi:hypothetical protein